jgi:hypothetical protein
LYSENRPVTSTMTDTKGAICLNRKERVANEQ